MVSLKTETGVAAAIVGVVFLASLAIKSAALMLATDLAANYISGLEPVGFLPSVGLVLLISLLTAKAEVKTV